MNNPLHELKARLKAKLEKDARFTKSYCKIVIDYVTEISDDIINRGGSK